MHRKHRGDGPIRRKLSDGSHFKVDVKASFTAEAAHVHGVVRRGEELLLGVDRASKALS
jgi:hypothetical protein